MSLYQRILVPVDGSETSRIGRDEAIRLAKLTQGTLRFFHVVDELSFALTFGTYGVIPDNWMQTLRADGERVLAEAAKAASAEGVQSESGLYEGFNEKVPGIVAAEATRWQADLIVVGSHGRRGFDRLVMGSGAEGILRESPVPVLLVRRKAPASDQAVEAAAASKRVSVATGALKIE